MSKNSSRRKFLKHGALIGVGTALQAGAAKHVLGNFVNTQYGTGVSNVGEPIIDIHQHTFYSGRTDTQLINHQKTMGVTTTVVLPVDNTPIKRMSTHYGYASALHGPNKTCYDFAQEHAGSFLFGANEVPDIPEATKEIEKYLKLGAKIIGELKFAVACDSKGMQKIYKLAAEYNVPVLMHWKYEEYNFGFPRFYKMLEKYPKTKFIGHAQTWWANIDKAQEDHPWELYPKGPVTKGGITDRYLSDYPNMYGGLAAGSGLNAFTRDEDFTKDFFRRHQDKLLFGSDCSDSVGTGKDCTGSQTIATIRRLVPGTIERKLLYENAKRILQI